MAVATSSTASHMGSKHSEGPLRGNWQTLWSYIRPFMVEHKDKTPPREGWVSHLINLPRVREIEWNTPWILTHPFRDTKARDVAAVIIQVTGEPAPTPCEKCAKGKGPFKGCVVISGEAQRPPVQRVFACANCFYHYGQSYCSIKNWGLKRAKRILRERKAWGTLDIVGYPSPQPGDEDAGDMDDEETEDEEADDADADADPETLSMESLPDAPDGRDVAHDGEDRLESRQVSGTPPPEFDIITEAEPGRPYNMWPGASSAPRHASLEAGLTNLTDSTTGELRATSGVLLPAGYKLDKHTPNRPWICPIRTCRQLFIKKNDLGYHFQVRRRLLARTRSCF